MPGALREEVPTALGEDLEGRVMDAGSSPAGSIPKRKESNEHHDRGAQNGSSQRMGG